MSKNETAPAPEEHSRLVGGSTAERRIACPASYQMEGKLPPSVKDDSSDYANEGTALHAAVAHALTENIVDPYALVGMEFEGYVMTPELVDDALAPCLAFFDELDEKYADEGGLQFLIEKRVEVPGIPGAFGTSDLIARTEKRSIIVDWKFGIGVPVHAFYEDAAGNKRPNSQLAYYARAAAHSYPQMFVESKKWNVELYIVQPRSRDEEGRVSHFSTNMQGLEDFRMQLIKAVSEAQGENPGMHRGGHCRFATCKTICPLWTGPALDLTRLHGALQKQRMESTVVKDLAVDWGAMYGEMLTLADLAEAIIKEIRTQAHTFLETGERIEGWKLVPKRAMRQWKDEAAALDALRALGLKDNDLFKSAMQSPAQVETVLKKAKKTLPADLTIAVSNGTTLAHADDRRPDAVPTEAAISSLSGKLTALIGR